MRRGRQRTRAARPTNRCQNLRTKFCASPGRRPAQRKAKHSRLHCIVSQDSTFRDESTAGVCHASVSKSVHLGPACLGLDRVQAGSQWHAMSEAQCSERSRCTDCAVHSLTGVIYAEPAEPDSIGQERKELAGGWRNAMEQLRATRNTRVVYGWPCPTAQ